MSQSFAQRASAASAELLAKEKETTGGEQEPVIKGSPKTTPEVVKEPETKQPEQQAAATTQEETKKFEVEDDKLFAHLSEKLGRPVTNYEDLTKIEEKIVEKEVEKLVEKEIDDPYAKKWLEYNKTTGRGFDDFVKSQRDISLIDGDQKAREYLRDVKYKGKITEQQLDRLISKNYKLDPAEFDEDAIADADLAYTLLQSEADEYFEKNQQSYRVPLPDIKSQADQQAAAAAQKEARDNAWKQAVETSAEKVDKISVDGYDHALTDKAELIEKYSTPDALTKQFQTKDGNLDFELMMKTIEAGKAVLDGSFAKGHAETVRNAVLEEETRKLNNHGQDNSERRAAEGGQQQMSQTEKYLASKIRQKRQVN